MIAYKKKILSQHKALAASLHLSGILQTTLVPMFDL